MTSASDPNPRPDTRPADPEKTEKAVRWLVSIPTLRRPRPIVPHLKAEFGLSAAEAIEALRESNLRLARAL